MLRNSSGLQHGDQRGVHIVGEMLESTKEKARAESLGLHFVL